MKKIDPVDVLFIIFGIAFTICVAINNVYMIPFVCELSIGSFGLNIGSIITVGVGYILISLIVACVIAVFQLIKCIYFQK